MDTDSSQNDPLDILLAALANTLRRRIVERLADGEVTVGELASMAGVSMPAISRHLNTLEEAGLVERVKRGRHQFCRLKTDPLRSLDEWSARFRPLWELEVDSLSDYLRHLQRRG